MGVLDQQTSLGGRHSHLATTETSPGTTTCSSPEELSKEWIVERLVEAGALPLQVELQWCLLP